MRIAHVTLAVVAASLLVTGVALGHNLFAPSSIQATAAGQFSYEITVHVTATTEFAYAEWDGTDNTDIAHWTVDGFCLQTVLPGDQHITVAGNLADPTLPGSVAYTHALCDGWQSTMTTVILPFPVAEQQQTWGAIKSLYR